MSSYFIFDKKADGGVSEDTLDDYLPLKGGIMGGDINMSNYSITNIPKATNPQEPTTKKQVDDELAKKLSLYRSQPMKSILDMDGFTISGLPVPSNDDEPTTKKYVEDNYFNKTSVTSKLGTKLNKSGGTMSGTLNMGSQRITTLPSPTANDHAVNKAYVDNALSTSGAMPKSGGTFSGRVNMNETTFNHYFGSDTRGWYQIFIKHPKSSVAGWYMGNQKQNPTTSDNDFYFTVRYTNHSYKTAGYISDSENNVKMNFTGQHRCRVDPTSLPLKEGLILEATGKYHNMDGTTSPSINDSIPIVKVCDSAASKKVFGVYSANEETERVYRAGNFVSLYAKAKDDDRVYCNSLGEGGIWVCFAGGNLENGDYIESFKGGYGRKQRGGTLKNTTVAKVTQDVDFTVARDSVTLGGKDYDAMFVGCSYHCG